jgi:diaminopimelate epimerase
MAHRNLQKWHGAGNDFLVDVIEQGSAPWWTPERAKAICNRSTGLGADGLLVATVGADTGMVLYNADGSIAEMSGNGIRVLAAAVRRVTRENWKDLTIQTGAGERVVTLTMEGDHGRGSVAMGEVRLEGTIDGALGVANVGNPHVVVLDQENWQDSERESLARRLSDEVGGANVEFLRVLGPDHLAIRVIERGVGWTQACGTGSCATAAVARAAGLSGDTVRVENPGGTLTVTLNGDHATLEGPVHFVGHVEWLEA